MTSGHFIFIPLMLALGALAGFILGARAARNQYDRAGRGDAERYKARAEGAAGKAARATAGPEPVPAAAPSSKGAKAPSSKSGD